MASSIAIACVVDAPLRRIRVNLKGKSYKVDRALRARFRASVRPERRSESGVHLKRLGFDRH